MCIKKANQPLWSFLWKIVCRRKIIIPDESDSLLNKKGEKLDKCLNLFDLVMLGTGSCLGSGIFVVAGYVAKHIAGPGVLLSFFIGGFASFLSGICYAEFGCRMPQTTGGAYVYSYITVGELIAFITGWNLILEYMIGTASGALAISSLINTLSNGEIADYMTNNTFPVMGRPYPDFIALGIAGIITAVVGAGVKSSVVLNNMFGVINIIVWLFSIIVGAIYAVPSIWSNYGFLPYGISGVLSGASTCFYAFIGFDMLATTGEETQDAGRVIPLAIVATLVVCLTVYMSVSVVLTLMVPYFDIAASSAFITVFKQRAFPGAQYVIMVGEFSGLTAALLGSAFPMPRIIYAMGSDGLLFSFLSKISPHTKTPLVATVISGTMAAILSLTIGLKQLIEMMSIGTLLAYSMVSLSILLLRYRPHSEDVDDDDDDCSRKAEDGNISKTRDNYTDIQDSTDNSKQSKNEMSSEPKQTSVQENTITNDTSAKHNIRNYSKLSYMLETFTLYFSAKTKRISGDSYNRVSRIMCFYLVDVFLLCLTLVLGENRLHAGELWLYLIISVLLMFAVISVWSVWCQPKSRNKCPFMAPGLPFLPCAALFINCYLMMKLTPFTWVRFAIWMVIGMLIYVIYGVKTAERIYQERMEILALLRTKKKDIVSCPNYSKTNQ